MSDDELDDPNDEFEQEEFSPEEEERARLRESIVTRLARALDLAAERLQRAASGESVYQNPYDLKATLAMLDLLPELLPLLESKSTVFFNQKIPLIPVCTVCGKGPGAHWPDSCPDNPDAKYKPPLLYTT